MVDLLALWLDLGSIVKKQQFWFQQQIPNLIKMQKRSRTNFNSEHHHAWLIAGLVHQNLQSYCHSGKCYGCEFSTVSILNFDKRKERNQAVFAPEMMPWLFWWTSSSKETTHCDVQPSIVAPRQKRYIFWQYLKNKDAPLSSSYCSANGSFFLQLTFLNPGMVAQSKPDDYNVWQSK